MFAFGTLINREVSVSPLPSSVTVTEDGHPPMRVAIYDRVEPPVPCKLPFRLEETCSHRAAAAMLVVAIPAVLAVGLASLALILHALFAPAARAIIAQHPALGLEILAAIAFWLTAVNDSPGGNIMPFCEPEMATSTLNSSWR